MSGLGFHVDKALRAISSRADRLSPGNITQGKEEQTSSEVQYLREIPLYDS